MLLSPSDPHTPAWWHPSVTWDFIIYIQSTSLPKKYLFSYLPLYHYLSIYLLIQTSIHCQLYLSTYLYLTDYPYTIHLSIHQSTHLITLGLSPPLFVLRAGGVCLSHGCLPKAFLTWPFLTGAHLINIWTKKRRWWWRRLVDPLLGNLQSGTKGGKDTTSY